MKRMLIGAGLVAVATTLVSCTTTNQAEQTAPVVVTGQLGQGKLTT